jgi:hypothetical protein
MPDSANSGIAVDLGIVTVGGNTLILKAGQSHRLQTVKGRGATVYHMPQAQSSTKPTFSCANAVFPKTIRYRQVYFHKRIVFFSDQTLQTNRPGRILVLGNGWARIRAALARRRGLSLLVLLSVLLDQTQPAQSVFCFLITRLQ